ncbi:MAG: hypothetical protein ACRC10_00915 [Thermoguttaceae bacterium]
MTEVLKCQLTTHNFGSRLRFGMMFELSDSHVGHLGHYLAGSVCYWFYGKSIGDIAYAVPLGMEGLNEIQWVLSNADKRREICSFFEMDAQMILDVMCADMDNDADNVAIKNSFGFVGTCEFWDAHRISLELDIMQEHLLLYFENESQARVIWSMLSEDKECYIHQGDFFLTKGEFDSIVEEACHWLQQEYEKELTLDSPDDWWNQLKQ